MKYNIYRDSPEQRQAPVPMNDDRWELVGSIESDSEPADMDWAKAVRETTGRNIHREADMGTWYMVLPEGRRP